MTLRGWEAKSLVDEQDEGEQFLGKHQFQHQSKAPFGVGLGLWEQLHFLENLLLVLHQAGSRWRESYHDGNQ